MRILVLTIEEEPPSLANYPTTDRQRTGQPFSRHFDDFYKKCLRKAPKARACTKELLKHKFLQKRSPDLLKSQLLDHLDAVGTHIPQENESTQDVLDSIQDLGTQAFTYHSCPY